jgi:phosphohistidine phosphatase
MIPSSIIKMKTLYLTRHAKSSWDDPNVEDIDRSLKSTGIQDAYLMGKHLKSKGISPEIILTSPAARAINTAVIFASQFNYPPEEIKIFQKIYESAPNDIIEAVLSAKTKANSIMIFGHDPSLTNLVFQLTGKELEKIPTSATAGIELQINDWNELSSAEGKFLFLEKPKELRAFVKQRLNF